MTILEFKNVSKSISKKNIISDVSFQVEHGNVFGLLGPNGAGKTTIIRLILGLLKPSNGEVCLKKEKNGVILHDNGLYLELSGYENLKIFGLLQGNFDKTEVYSVLEEVGLAKVAKDPVRTYSQGMKKRLCLARCILRKAELIVLDEPTVGLDIDGKRWFVNKIKELSKNGTTIIISSHDLSEINIICTHIAIIRNGKLLINDSIDKLRKSFDGSLEKLYLSTGDDNV
ncbi:ABC transporter ATP-binding protein [Clostridiaceae bacterium M8S5]|nr:ABC transporter ATP-binding protein [Clostridiaceae bacterium M8S5]